MSKFLNIPQTFPYKLASDKSPKEKKNNMSLVKIIVEKIRLVSLSN